MSRFHQAMVSRRGLVALGGAAGLSGGSDEASTPPGGVLRSRHASSVRSVGTVDLVAWVVGVAVLVLVAIGVVVIWRSR